MTAAPVLDALVVGLGAMGSATLYELARRGARVAGIDRFEPPHTQGSTHGRTRIIREAYYESPVYVPLIRRAYELWHDLERVAGERLLHQTGGLMIGPPDGELVSGALRSAREHDIPHEMLDASAVARRFPHFELANGDVALLEMRAGILFPERCVATTLTLASRHGADIRTGHRLLSWEAGTGVVRCHTDHGEVAAARLVVCAGPWLPELVANLSLPLEVERQTFHWFIPEADRAHFGPDRCPIALWEYERGRLLATFPDFGDGVKVGVHHEGEITTPRHCRRTISDDEDALVRGLLARCLPLAAGTLSDSAVCLYTNTPDHHFVLDRHPESDRVILVSPCSGHGFKFASVIGEIGAQLALGDEPSFDLEPFRLSRFSRAFQ